MSPRLPYPHGDPDDWPSPQELADDARENEAERRAREDREHDARLDVAGSYVPPTTRMSNEVLDELDRRRDAMTYERASIDAYAQRMAPAELNRRMDARRQHRAAAAHHREVVDVALLVATALVVVALLAAEYASGLPHP